MVLKVKPKQNFVNNEDLEARIKVATTEAAKTAAGEAVELAMKELDQGLAGKTTPKSNKIQDIIKKAKGHDHDEISCPNCKNNGHSHALKDMGSGKLKCTGDDCGDEFTLINNKADYFCKSCHTPHLKPKTVEEQDAAECPFCGGNTFLKSKGSGKEWDFDKIRERVGKAKAKLDVKAAKASEKAVDTNYNYWNKISKYFH